MTDNEIVEDALITSNGVEPRIEKVYGADAEKRLAEFLAQYPQVEVTPIVARPEEKVNMRNWKLLEGLLAAVNKYRHTDLPGKVIMEIPFPTEDQPWSVAYLKITHLLPFETHPQGLPVIDFYEDNTAVGEIVHALTPIAEFFQTPHTIEEIEAYFRTSIESFLRDKGITPNFVTNGS